MRFSTSASIVLVFVGGLFIGAQEPKREAEPHRLDHKTLYFAPGIENAHRFEVEGMIAGGGGTGRIVVDPNTCQLNEFGDRTVCTQIAPTPVPVQFRRLRLPDPCMTDREVYEVAGPDLPQQFRFFLVIGKKTQPEVLRLVVEVKEARSAFPLVPRKECDQADG